jgi:hypothetical protein
MTVEEAGAVAEAVRVTVAEHVGLHGLLENAEAVTPLGRVVSIVKVTADVVPADSVAVAVSTPPGAPSVIDKLEGDAVSVKSNVVTTSVNVVVRVTAGVPPVAWIVITVEEAGAVTDAVKVTVALQVGLQGLFVKADADTPVGRVVRILKVTGVVVAPVASVAVAVSTPPGPAAVIDRLDGLAASVKSKKPETFRVNVVV